MNKRTVLLVCVGLALAGVYLRFFTDLRKHQEIQISWEKSRAAFLRGSETPGIIFHLNKSYPLTSVEVVEADDARTNKHPHALWHVVATAAPVPTDTFAYGGAIRGMKPEISTAVPEPLEADTDYSLLVEAGKNLKAQAIFQRPY